MVEGWRAGGGAREDTLSVSHWLVFGERLTFVMKSKYDIVLYNQLG